MSFRPTLDQLQGRPKLCREIRRRIPNHLQTTAMRRTLGPKSSENDVAPFGDRAVEGRVVGGAVGGIREEVKDRAIVP